MHEECEQCVQECDRASQWNRSHSRHTSTHIYARTTYRRCRTMSAHMCPSAFTLGHVCADKLIDVSSDLRPSVKAL